MGTKVVGCGNWYVVVGDGVDEDAALGGGGEASSSERRVSRHQNLQIWHEAVSKGPTCVVRNGPKRSLAVREILAFPGDDVQYVEDAVVTPVIVQDAVEHRLRRQR